MIDRKIELTFDEKKQAARAICTEIPQRSSIPFILYSIYIRFQFSEIKNEHEYARIKYQALLTMLLSKSNRKAQKKIANYSLKLFKKYFHEQIKTQ